MKKIYINPGHSDKDPGAVGYETERVLNVKVSNYQRDYLLEHYVCEVRMNPGTVNSTAMVAADANAWGADLLVSNHFNAAGGDGYEALVYSEKRRELGEIFEKHVLAIGQNSRGVKLRPGLRILNSTNMPAILNEGAFVDNLTDIQDWNEDHELQAMGIAYAKAAAEYLAMEEKQTAPEVPAEPKADPSTEEPATVQVTLQVLRKGCECVQVERVQSLLAVMGYYKSTIDGDFGNLTDAAVRAFQRAAGITKDGIVGQQTWDKLLGAT